MSKHAKPFILSKSARLVLAVVGTLIAAALAVVGILIGLSRHQDVLPSSSLPAAATTTSETATTTTTTTEPSTTTTTKVVFKELTFSSPAKTTFTTTESSVAFSGSTDPSSTLTVNGKNIPLSTIGGFSIDQKLTEGVNTFRFESGGKTVTYKITYQIDILRSVTPDKALTLEGGGSIQFRATAHKKAALTATFNGKTLKMSRTIDTDGEAFDDGGDFTTYQATFTLPAGTANKQQSLGSATVTAKYNGLTETMKSGAVTVKAVTATRYITVTRDYAETFSGSVVNDYSRPDSAYLPAGTVDKIVKTGSAAGNTYYLLGCGRWVYTKDVEITDKVKSLTKTALRGGQTTVTDKATVLAFDADWKIPYNVQLAPQTYKAPNASVPDYAITEQTTEYIDLTFYYTDKTPTAPSMKDSPLFSSAAWRTTDGNPVLRLTLRKKGQFYGYSVRWEENTLVFSFKHPNSAADNPAEKPLQGMRIVLDAGHGGSSVGTYSTIAGYYEKTAVLDYSLVLQKKLEALGATVVMTRTTDVLPDNPTMSTRTAHARNNNTDLLLSIHMNGSQAASASGCTLHYFNEYSYTVAKRLTDTMRAVEKAHGVGNRNQVTVWSPFFMARLHDCPAVLIECGFMTNAHNMQKLVDATYKDQLTDAIVKAVVDYFSSLPIYETSTTTTTTTTTTTSTTTTTTTTEPDDTSEPTDDSSSTTESTTETDTTESTTSKTDHNETSEGGGESPPPGFFFFQNPRGLAFLRIPYCCYWYCSRLQSQSSGRRLPHRSCTERWWVRW